ncbi:MAG: hypothetical protein WCK90_02440 [archaeon]
MESKDPIKEAFSKVKQDIELLRDQLLNQHKENMEIKRTLKEIQTHIKEIKTFQQINPTVENTPTDNLPLYAPKPSNLASSIGNRGVPTDRQTNQQTDRQIKIEEKSGISKVSDILDSLENIKGEVRFKFKHLTTQEMQVFSMLYSLEDQGMIVDYSLLAEKLSLSEGSIRDYIMKLLDKGIPILKTKENNKKVALSVDKSLRQIASLEVLQRLRDA